MMTRDHASQQQIRRFARGKATAEESREVVRHLLHGCAGCGHQVAAALGLLRPAAGVDYGAAVERSCRRLAARRRSFDEERRAAARQWDFLARLAPGERMAAVRRDQGLQTLALFARLLEAARADSHGEGSEREEIVQLALAVLDLLAPALGAPLCADLRAEAWCEVAGARWEQADLEGAGAAMTAAWAYFHDGTGGVDLKALLLGRDAALLAAAGELAAAERLLSTVAALYRRLRDDRREGQALLELAQVAGQLDPDKGAALAERSLPVLRRAGDGRLELAALHRCAWFLIEAGRCREARARLDFARPLERDAGDDDAGDHRFRRLWLEARLAFRLGNGSGARVRFERLLALAERRGLRQELVLVGVDLAAVHAAGGESERCAGVLDSLYPLLVEWRLHLDGLETWVRLQQEVSRRRPDAQRLLRAAARYYLRYWERPPRAREKVVAS